jgi:ABC-2 type transport system ATP-binding protein
LEDAVPVIRVRDLTKSYGPVEAVRGIDLDVADGEVFALLGPNGAGKTTTTEILEGYRARSGGELEVLGHDPERAERDFRARIGIVLQECGMFDQLTVQEVLDLHGRYYPRRRPTAELIELVELGEKRSARVGSLSGGQRRRVDLALALVGDPELIFLDEPTTGFDPSARRNAWSVIRSLCSLGKTVFLTTHFMDEAQALADRVAVVAAGRIVAEGSPDSLGGRDVAAAEISFSLPEGADPGWLHALDGAVVDGDRFAIRSASATATLHEITGWAVDQGIELATLTVTRPSLEDVYLQLTRSTPSEEVAR